MSFFHSSPAAKLLATACLLSSATGFAQGGDPEAGRVKAYTCTGCHGIPGYVMAYPTYHVPKLGGQHAQYIESALKAYREGERKHPTMQAQARALSDQDIADIAAYFASIE